MIYAAFASLLFLGAFLGSLAVIAAMLTAYGARARHALRHLAPHGYGAAARPVRKEIRLSPLRAPAPARALAA